MQNALSRVADLQGLWRRSLLAWPDGRRDVSTQVLWLQGLRAYGDLRQPDPAADFSHVHCLSDLAFEDCSRLAQQQGFAGHLTFDGQYFEWARMIDFQPPSRTDAGSLRWEGEVLIERGREVEYLEHWHRELARNEPSAALLLREARRGIRALLVRVGEFYIFARDRGIALAPGTSLAECVAGAPNLEAARALVDCEISFGTVSADGFRVGASTLPFRVGTLLHSDLEHHWEVLDSEGDVAALAGWRTPKNTL